MQIISTTKTHGFQHSTRAPRGGINFHIIAEKLRKMGSPGSLQQIESRMRKQAIELGLISAHAAGRHV